MPGPYDSFLAVRSVLPSLPGMFGLLVAFFPLNSSASSVKSRIKADTATNKLQKTDFPDPGAPKERDTSPVERRAHLRTPPTTGSVVQHHQSGPCLALLRY